MVTSVRSDRLPLTYDECRARFRHALTALGMSWRSLPVAARGPDGQSLSLDAARFGTDHARRVLLVMSGTHGVEGFIGSDLQCAFVDRLAARSLPSDVAVVLVHAVNPWGMAWWRRQNEANVDLNRNWRRDQNPPIHNEPYDEIHALACPDTPDLPSVDDLLVAAAAIVDERGLSWVRDAITAGQYRHPDGLHFGGDRTQDATRALEQFLTTELAGVERLLTVDLHTGHGPWGEAVALSDAPPGSAQDRFLRIALPDATVEATTGNPDATTGVKSGQIANGLRDLVSDATCFSTSLEIGTASAEEQLVATYQEQWVHRRGDRANPEHAAAIWAYRCCFTPDDPAWERRARDLGAVQLDTALAAVSDWS